MPLTIPADVSTTLRGRLTTRQRLQAWERTSGTCVVCGRQIDGVRERWIVEHIRALELGGADAPENLGPAHEGCGRAKTRDDHAYAAEAKRRKAHHLGFKTPRTSFPGSRSGPLKRKLDGTVVPRATFLTKRCPEGPIIFATVEAALKTATQPTSSEASDAVCHETPEADGAAAAAEAAAGRWMAGSVDGSPTSPGDAVPGSNDRSEVNQPLVTASETCSPPPADDVDRQIVKYLGPSDPIEALWVRDICRLVGEASRLHGWRTLIIEQARAAAVQQLIRPMLEIESRDPGGGGQMTNVTSLSLGWVAGREASLERVDRLLNDRGLTQDCVAAKAFQLTLSDVERINRLIAAADCRRDALLAALARRRAAPE